MKEKFSQNENSEEKDIRFLSDAIYVINSMWEKVIDTEDLPLDVDLSYKAWGEDLKKRKSEFARVLFKKAREESGEKKLSYARTLKRLTKLLDDSSRQEVLRGLLTNQEAVEELVAQAKKEVNAMQTKPERIKSKFREKIDRFLRRDDDFDDDLK